MEEDKAVTGTTMQPIVNSDQLTLAEIRPMIRVIRGRQVMLGRDLAKLYGVTAGHLNEQVKRNIENFPDDFMFQLSNEEFKHWKSRFATSKSIIMGTRKKPYAFTEQGISVFSSVLRSPVAIEVNIRKIM